jgi:hypothetical protein
MITSRIVADSVAVNGKRITTFELEYPRFIHSEFMTHRALSRNAASSRAIPVNAMLRHIWDDPAVPVHWGRNTSGMQAKEELDGWRKACAEFLWDAAGRVTCGFAWLLNKIGAHKQIVNRIVEPWSHIKVVATATDWDNFFHLRNHPDAQPEINELALLMYGDYLNSTPQRLKKGKWHLPYVTENDALNKDDAIKLSASLCAQVSYRKADQSLDKALLIYDRLIDSKPCHASPFEHQATPAPKKSDRSGNFSGWIQYRQQIADNVCSSYKC